MYPNLKLQLWKCGIRQNRLAQLLGIHETLLSRILNGYREPDSVIRERISAILGSDEEWLFAKISAGERDREIIVEIKQKPGTPN